MRFFSSGAESPGFIFVAEFDVRAKARTLQNLEVDLQAKARTFQNLEVVVKRRGGG